MRIIVTGGAGFIGSNFLNHMVKKYPNYHFINIDKLTYSGNLNNLKEISNNSNYEFHQQDICNKKEMSILIKEGDIIVNFAAESHVDNSIVDPESFVRTNILGVQNLLDISRKNKAKLFIQISTDEVYGSLEEDQPSSKETDNFFTSSPYSASKAAAELLCLACAKTFKQPIIITRSSNNFGPYQYPEKLIPLFITNLLENKEVPVYGNGKNIRDWIYVLDNCEAIDFILHNGKIGEIYNIGGGNEVKNIDLTYELLKLLGKDEKHISFVKDRPGHDLRYSLDSSKIHSLGWKPRFTFNEALVKTARWYESNYAWWKPLKMSTGVK